MALSQVSHGRPETPIPPPKGTTISSRWDFGFSGWEGGFPVDAGLLVDAFFVLGLVGFADVQGVSLDPVFELVEIGQQPGSNYELANACLGLKKRHIEFLKFFGSKGLAGLQNRVAASCNRPQKMHSYF